MDILIATQNPAKVLAYGQSIKMTGHNLITKDLILNISDWPDVPETHDSLEMNALHKALTMAKFSNYVTFASDEGFSVEYYTKELNELLRIEPRRIGHGRRLSDVEVVEWHNEQLKKVGGWSPARFTLAIALATPDGKTFVKSFPYNIKFYERGDNFPMIREGWPLDSQSKSIKLDKFVSELTEAERLDDMPLRDISYFIREYFPE